ncbi:hypothetical protein H0H93_005124, partial [Arthromyces matolae]
CCMRMRVSIVCKKLSPSSTRYVTPGGSSRLPSSFSSTKSTCSLKSCHVHHYQIISPTLLAGKTTTLHASTFSI